MMKIFQIPKFFDRITLKAPMAPWRSYKENEPLSGEKFLLRFSWTKQEVFPEAWSLSEAKV